MPKTRGFCGPEGRLHPLIVSFGDPDVGEFASARTFELRSDIYQVFLFSQEQEPPRDLTLNDVDQRGWGWVNIRPGALRDTNTGPALLYSEIHGERCASESCNPDKWVQWLKRQIKKEARVGVVGRNVVYGGEYMYKDIWYTDKAKELFDAGVLWKQFIDDNGVFEPVVAEGE